MLTAEELDTVNPSVSTGTDWICEDVSEQTEYQVRIFMRERPRQQWRHDTHVRPAVPVRFCVSLLKSSSEHRLVFIPSQFWLELRAWNSLPDVSSSLRNDNKSILCFSIINKKLQSDYISVSRSYFLQDHSSLLGKRNWGGIETSKRTSIAQRYQCRILLVYPQENTPSDTWKWFMPHYT